MSTVGHTMLLGGTKVQTTGDNQMKEQILSGKEPKTHSIRFNGDGGPNNMCTSIYLNKKAFAPGELERASGIRISIELLHEGSV